MAVLSAVFSRGLLASLIFSITVTVAAENRALSLPEQKIKAGLLYNFLKYTQWPLSEERPSSTIVCLWGGDAFNGNLQAIHGRIVNQQQIVLREIDSLEKVTQCHLVFINAEAQNEWPKLAQILAGKSVLTVSDFSGFIHAGGMIQFGRKNQHIEIAVNIQAITDAQLYVQDSLLRLATVVYPSTPENMQ